jgi:hypothetical protein
VRVAVVTLEPPAGAPIALPPGSDDTGLGERLRRNPPKRTFRRVSLRLWFTVFRGNLTAQGRSAAARDLRFQYLRLRAPS